MGIAAAALCALLLAGAAAEAVAGPHPAHRPPPKKRYHGVSDTGVRKEFGDFKREVKAHPAVLQEFFHWDVSLTASGAVKRWEQTDALGMVSLSTEKPARDRPDLPPRSIARGNGDRYILRYNEVLSKLKQPTYIRLFPEMNGHWNPYSAYNADGSLRSKAYRQWAFRRAWKRFVIITRGGKRAKINQRLRRHGMARIYKARSNRDPIYRRKGVPRKLKRPKVAFLWVPQSFGSPNIRGNQPPDYWPGRNFVDWVGVDIFAAYESAAFPSMKRFFRRYDDWPFVIGEYAPWDADPGGRFTDRLFDWAERKARVRMLVYYRSTSVNSAYNIDKFPAARDVLRRHLNKRTWKQYAPGTRD